MNMGLERHLGSIAVSLPALPALPVFLLALVLLQGATGVAQAKGPCTPPPYDPLVEVSSALQARSMDGWARKALRRDVRGRTCEEVREVVDILIIRWLQAHPDIVVAFDTDQQADLLADSRAFLARIKAEAWVHSKGARGLLPRCWGRDGCSERCTARRQSKVERTVLRLTS